VPHWCASVPLHRRRVTVQLRQAPLPLHRQPSSSIAKHHAAAQTPPLATFQPATCPVSCHRESRYAPPSTIPSRAKQRHHEPPLEVHCRSHTSPWETTSLATLATNWSADFTPTASHQSSSAVTSRDALTFLPTNQLPLFFSHLLRSNSPQSPHRPIGATYA